MLELEIALLQKTSFCPAQAASPTLTLGSNQTQSSHLSSDESCYKSPSETSRAMVAPPTAGFGGRPWGQRGFLLPATMCSQRALQRPWESLAALGVSTSSKRILENKPFSFESCLKGSPACPQKAF